MSRRLRCAIYTRKSTEEGLDQDYNSLEAQRDACVAYIKSQAGEGWTVVKQHYDDGGFSGGSMERPALQQLLNDIGNKRVDIVVVYKVDRLTRSLADFAKIVEILDSHSVSFVSVTQQFNTTSSMGRLTLNVLLSFAQFEREVTAERIRDKIAASKKKGLWMGGVVPLGYDVVDRKLVVNEPEAETVRTLFDCYLRVGTVKGLKDEADRLDLRTKTRKPNNGRRMGGVPFTIGHLHKLLTNRLYLGEMTHKGASYPGEHGAIVDQTLWDAVQEQLARNAQERSRSANTKNRNLLTGLLFDADDRRIAPHYCVKQGRRYRYYVSRDPDARMAWRLPAKAIESAVLNGIIDFLEDERRLVDRLDLKAPSTATIKETLSEAAQRAAQLKSEAPVEQHAALHDLVECVEVTAHCLRVAIRSAAIWKGPAKENGQQMDSQSAADIITIELPVTFKRRGVETKLVIDGGKNAPADRDPALIDAVTSASRWFHELQTGQARSIKELAESHTVDKGDVSRILPLAFLAPDIVEAILDGRQPVDLTAYRLKRLRTLPPDWQEQRRLLGFA